MGDSILKDGGNSSLKNAGNFFSTLHHVTIHYFNSVPSVAFADPDLRRTV